MHIEFDNNGHKHKDNKVTSTNTALQALLALQVKSAVSRRLKFEIKKATSYKYQSFMQTTSSIAIFYTQPS